MLRAHWSAAPPRWVERHGRTMGSTSHLVCWGTDADADWAERELARLESLWSRFLPDSDVTRLNRAAGRGPVTVAPETAALVADACSWWEITGGRFDPTVLHALEAHGYDAPFTEVRERPVTRPVVASAPPGRPALRIPATSAPRPDAPTPGCAGISWSDTEVALPEGVGLDLGGIGKGAAADRIVAGLRERGVPAACLSLGGDVRAFGAGSDPEGWLVPVEDPRDESVDWFSHRVHDGAVVTSTDRFRRWVHDGREQHHLIDPRTGRPAETGLVAVVVAHAGCAAAEVLAKAAFVGGPGSVDPLLTAHGARAWLLHTDGTTSTVPSTVPPTTPSTDLGTDTPSVSVR